MSEKIVKFTPAEYGSSHITEARLNGKLQLASTFQCFEIFLNRYKQLSDEDKSKFLHEIYSRHSLKLELDTNSIKINEIKITNKHYFKTNKRDYSKKGHPFVSTNSKRYDTLSNFFEDTEHEAKEYILVKEEE